MAQSSIKKAKEGAAFGKQAKNKLQIGLSKELVKESGLKSSLGTNPQPIDLIKSPTTMGA